MIKKILTALVFLGVAGFTGAQTTESSVTVNGAYYFPSAQGQGSDSWFVPPAYQVLDNPQDPTPAGEIDSFGGWGAPGAQVLYDWSVKYPMLNSEGALFEGNNLTLGITGDLTPVTAVAQVQATLTPIAILKFRGGLAAGTGWTVFGLKGLGINTDGETAPGSFSGALLKAYAGATFQFDFGAIFPGDWNHVVTVADMKAEYQDFTGTGDNEPWYWQVDAGENFDGFQLLGTYFLGWQMPKGLPLALVGVLTTSQTYLRDVPGTDYVKWESGPMAQFNLGPGSTLVVLLQAKSKREYTPGTAFRSYFLDRTYETTNFELSQLALSWTLKL